nr:MAG TPA: hypothetical protein [Caudoviricetes sp.]
MRLGRCGLAFVACVELTTLSVGIYSLVAGSLM